jgi:ribosome-binding factor A
MPKVNRRQQRINQLIRDEIDRLLRHETDDPELGTMISITEVETTQDLQKAKIYVSFLDDEHEAAIMARLRKAAHFFRREVAEALNLRHTPEFEFIYDASIARGARVLQLLREYAPPPETPDGTDPPAAPASDTAPAAPVTPKSAD